MTAQLATISNPNNDGHAREAFLAFVRALAVRQARIDAMVASAANDNRPS
ncbi:hypothetical protein [Rhizobium mesoamericanum]|nr:hypothetical protein [Rhizobium mesoamericanum]